MIVLLCIEFQKESLQLILGLRRELAEVTRLLNVSNIDRPNSTTTEVSSHPALPVSTVDALKALSAWTENGSNRAFLVCDLNCQTC
jgi:hypothetical protein